MAGELGAADAQALELLLSAPNKAAVNDLFILAFNSRTDGPSNTELVGAAELLGGATGPQTKACISAIRRAILKSAYSANTDAANIRKSLPAELDEQLAKLIVQIVSHHLPTWKESLIQSQVSGPRLLDLDWRVDVKTASDQLSRMALPTTMVELQVQETARKRGELAPVNNITFEMNKEALNTMLEGLVKIRSQLSDVAQ